MHVPAFFAFLLAALIGLTMALFHLRGGLRPPLTMGIAHGIFHGAGFIFLITALVQNDAGAEGWGWGLVALFTAAAAGGSYLFHRNHVRHEGLPTPVLLAHGGLALVTVVLLGVWVFTQQP